MDIFDFQHKFAHHIPTLQNARAQYAVLVPLVHGPEGLSLLYEVRSPKLRHHAAEVCFPGGRMEAGETAEECALRETHEELGIAPEHVQLIGQLDFLYLRSESLMHPVLAYIDAEGLQSMQCNTDEVQETFLVPINWLRANPPQLYHYELKPIVKDDFPYEKVNTPPGYRWSAGKMEVPVYDGLAHPLWGLTGRITYWLMRSMDA